MFDNKKLHLVPPILTDSAEGLLNVSNIPEVREQYAQRFEVARDYCDYVLSLYNQSKRQGKAIIKKVAKKN